MTQAKKTPIKNKTAQKNKQTVKKKIPPDKKKSAQPPKKRKFLAINESTGLEHLHKQKTFRDLSIRYKIAIIMAILLTFSATLITTNLLNQQTKMMEQEMRKRGLILTQSLVNAGFEAIVNHDKAVSGDVITEIMKDSSIIYASITDRDSEVVDSSMPGQTGQRLPEFYTNLINRLEESKIHHAIRDEKKVLEVLSPIYLEYKNKRRRIGTAILALNWQMIRKEMLNMQINVILITLVLLAVSILVSLLLAGTMTRPILKIGQVMEKVGDGDLKQSVHVKSNDEIGKLGHAFNNMIRHLKEKDMMSKYVSKSTISMIEKQKNGTLKRGGQRKKLTMFFSDIRGFTAFSETVKPEKVITMLNSFLSFQADIIQKNGGVIDKFVGDEVVAIFEGPHMIEHAMDSAVEILKKMEDTRKKLKQNIHIGIGMHTGVVVRGNMGSRNRMDYTVIGDCVNTAARLCGAAPRGQILITQEVYKQAPIKTFFEGPEDLKVKGKVKPLKVYYSRT